MEKENADSYMQLYKTTEQKSIGSFLTCRRCGDRRIQFRLQNY